MKTIVLLSVALLLSGCALFQPTDSKVRLRDKAERPEDFRRNDARTPEEKLARPENLTSPP